MAATVAEMPNAYNTGDLSAAGVEGPSTHRSYVPGMQAEVLPPGASLHASPIGGGDVQSAPRGLLPPMSETLVRASSGSAHNARHHSNTKMDSALQSTVGGTGMGQPLSTIYSENGQFASSQLDTAALDTALQKQLLEVGSSQLASADTTGREHSSNKAFYGSAAPRGAEGTVPLPTFNSVFVGQTRGSHAGSNVRSNVVMHSSNPLMPSATQHQNQRSVKQAVNIAMRSESGAVGNGTAASTIPSFDPKEVLARKNSATERLAALWTRAAESQKYNVQKHFTRQDDINILYEDDNINNYHRQITPAGGGGAASSTLSKLDLASVSSVQAGGARGGGQHVVDLKAIFNQKQWPHTRLSARSNNVAGNAGGAAPLNLSRSLSGLHQLGGGGAPQNNYRMPIGLSQLRSKDDRVQKARHATPMQHQSIASVSSRMTSVIDDRSEVSSQFSTRIRRRRGRPVNNVHEDDFRGGGGATRHRGATKQQRDGAAGHAHYPPGRSANHQRSRSVHPGARSRDRSPVRSARRRSISFESAVMDDMPRGSPRRRHRKHSRTHHGGGSQQLYEHGADPLWFHPPRRAQHRTAYGHTPAYPAELQGAGAPSLSPVASRSMLTCNREFQRCYPNVYQGLCKGLLDVNRLITQEIVIPVKEEISLHKSSIRSRWAVTSAISEHLWRAVHGKFPDPKIAPRLVRKVADYLYDKIEAGVQEAEDERSLLQWLMRFDVENGIDVRVTTSMVVGFNSVIANIEGAAHIRRRKGNMMSLVSKDAVLMDIEVVIKALFLNGGQLAEINNDPVFSDIVLAGESRFAAQFILPH